MRDEYRKSVKVTMATGKDNKSFDNVNDHRKTAGENSGVSYLQSCGFFSNGRF
jgi:hypothetical protein